MNKAKSFNEFYNILKMKALPGYNIGYADKYDTIFYISNGLIPVRKKGFNWKGVVKGDTKETLWNSTYNIQDLPKLFNLSLDIYIMQIIALLSQLQLMKIHQRIYLKTIWDLKNTTTIDLLESKL